MKRTFALLALLAAAPSAQQFRMGALNSSNTEEQLNYLQSLGYTHVYFPIQGTSQTDVTRRRNELALHRDLIRARGMQPIPNINIMSHLNGSMRRTAVIPDHGGHILNGHLAIPGGRAKNPGAWDDFHEILSDIAWAFPGGLPFIHIGHDELRTGTYLLSNRQGALRDVAEGLAARFSQINSVLGSSVRFLIWGDSFLPANNGELMGFHGNPVTGAGGILDILTMPVSAGGFGVPKSRFLVLTWGYGPEGRNFVPGDNMNPPNDKVSQLRYLHNLGIEFMVGTGENTTSFDGAGVRPPIVFTAHLQTFYEWVQAVHKVNSPLFRGYINMLYTDFMRGGAVSDANGLDVTVNAGYTFPIVEYAQRHGALFTGRFSPFVFANFDFMGSRNTRSLVSVNAAPPRIYCDIGNDYDGDGLADISEKSTTGHWMIDFAAGGFGSWQVTYPGYGDGSAEAVPADYDGDGRIDMSVKTTAGRWLIDFARDGRGSWNLDLGGYGGSTSEAVPADYNGDGAVDLAVKTTGQQWLIDFAVPGAANNGFGSYNLSLNGYGDHNAKAVPADYNGDGLADLAVKTTGGGWNIDYAVRGAANNGFGSWDLSLTGYGNSSALPIPADYNGDGLSDLAVRVSDTRLLIDYSDPSSPQNGFGSWNLALSGYGDGTTRPVPADYNGDGMADIVVRTGDGKWLIDYSVRNGHNNGFGSWNAVHTGYGGSSSPPIWK